MLNLEGKVAIARLVPPQPDVIMKYPTTFVDYFRVRIDPEKSENTDSFIKFEFDGGAVAGLHIRRAIVEFVNEPDKYYRKPGPRFTLVKLN